MKSVAETIEHVLMCAVAHCASCSTALLLEDALKLHLMDSLLREGHKIRVGGHQKNVDRVLSLDASGELWWEDVRRSTRRGRFADISVEDVGATMELKVFGEVGSKDFPEKPGLQKDLLKVTTGAADALLVICAAKAYEQLCKDTKKYKLKTAFPDIANIKNVLDDYTGLSWCSAPIKVRAARVDVALNGGTAQRVVMAVMKG